MKLKSILICAALLLAATAASAQDLKPVKDKSTKLYGYQDKSKNWVIEPSFSAAKRFSGGFAVVEQNGQKGLINSDGNWILKPEYDSIDKFDKAGLCEVMRKDGKTKLRGIANTSGELVIPVECLAVSVNRSEGLIMAERYAETPRAGLKPMWGVYDLEGGEVFAPSLASSPSFHNGLGIAKSAMDGLLGIISSSGEVLLPFDNLAISYSAGGFQALGSDFVSRSYDSRMFKSSELVYPGYVAPYEPDGDAVRAAAWHAGPIAMRLHSNNLKLASIGQDSRSLNAVCSDLPIDWGYGRFVRLEPFADTQEHPGAMLNPEDGSYYTIKAILYEADGRFVQEVSRWGWLEAECSDGIIYNAEGVETWMIMKDINTPAIPSFSLSLGSYRAIDHGDVLNCLGIRSYDISRMYDPSSAVRRYSEIREGENFGITSYLPRPAPELRMVRMLDDAMRSPLFRRPFGMGQVVNCKATPVEGGLELDMSGRLVLPFADKFTDPSFSMKGEEEIYWGPHNARTVMLSLEAAEGGKDEPGTSDDMFGSERKLCIVISLYEEDGQWLRTLAVAPAADYISDGIIVFEKLGIALDTRRHEKRVKLQAQRLEPTLSALTGAAESLFQRPVHRR